MEVVDELIIYLIENISKGTERWSDKFDIADVSLL